MAKIKNNKNPLIFAMAKIRKNIITKPLKSTMAKMENQKDINNQPWDKWQPKSKKLNDFLIRIKIKNTKRLKYPYVCPL